MEIQHKPRCVLGQARGDQIKRPTVQDVADLAGVTKMTVSLVMREKPGISADTAARIKECAKKLGYVRNLRRGRNASFVGAPMFHVPDQRDVNLARHFCRPWTGRGIEQEELWGEAMLALMNASCTFDPSRQVSFGTHLMWAVKSRLRVAFGHRFQQRLRYGVVFVEADAPLSEDGEQTLLDKLSQEVALDSGALYVEELLSLASPDEHYCLARRYVDCELPVEIAKSSGRSVSEVCAFIDSGLQRIRDSL